MIYIWELVSFNELGGCLRFSPQGRATCGPHVHHEVILLIRETMKLLAYIQQIDKKIGLYLGEALRRALTLRKI